MQANDNGHCPMKKSWECLIDQLAFPIPATTRHERICLGKRTWTSHGMAFRYAPVDDVNL